MKILLVDDFDSIRTFMGRTLNKEGYETTEAANGKEAIEKIKKMEFDAIISDYNMPLMNGIDLLKEARACNKHRHVPFFIVSTKADPKLMIEAKKHRLNGWVQKPYDQEVFFTQIKYAIRQSKQPA